MKHSKKLDAGFSIDTPGTREFKKRTKTTKVASVKCGMVYILVTPGMIVSEEAFHVIGMRHMIKLVNVDKALQVLFPTNSVSLREQLEVTPKVVVLPNVKNPHLAQLKNVLAVHSPQTKVYEMSQLLSVYRRKNPKDKRSRKKTLGLSGNQNSFRPFKFLPFDIPKEIENHRGFMKYIPRKIEKFRRKRASLDDEDMLQRRTRKSMSSKKFNCRVCRTKDIAMNDVENHMKTMIHKRAVIDSGFKKKPDMKNLFDDHFKLKNMFTPS
ncbi:hypothetical protein PCE1_000934 [Barthelona sp. PCE]